MTRIQSSWHRLAQSVIAIALADLGEVNLVRLYGGSKRVLQDEAAWWFTDGEHEIWCEMAGLDSDEVLLAAQIIADKMRSSTKASQNQP